jgi:hypothetical protein
MIRSVEARLRKLEADHTPTAFDQWHRVIGRSPAECEAQRHGMIEAGRAEDTDGFVFRILVTPKSRYWPK